MSKNNLNNHLLISLPHLNDDVFGQSVILICDHNLDGAMGLIVNKPIKSDKKNLFKFNSFIKNINGNIYFGGPVNVDICFILHDNGYSITKSKFISKELLLTSNKQIIDDIENNSGPDNYKFNLGYAGWSPGQLEKEIKSGDWLAIPNPKNFIFDVPDRDKWNYVLKELGINFDENWGSSGGQA